MKKLFAILLSVCLLTLCLAGCGGSSIKNTVPDIAAAVRDASDIVNPIDIDDDELYYNMAITMDNIEEYKGFFTGVTGSSGTVLVIKAKSGKADAVKAELETYKAKNADLLSTYPEFAMAQTQAENGRIVAKGDVIVLSIAGAEADYSAIDTAIENALQ